MAHGGIQQELNVLCTCSLSSSVSEKGTERTVSAFTLGRATGRFDLVRYYVVDCTHEWLECQPVAPNPIVVQAKACRQIYAFIHLIVL